MVAQVVVYSVDPVSLCPNLPAISANILYGYVAPLLSVDCGEVSCHPGHMRGLSLLLRQASVVTGICRVEAVKESMCLMGNILRWRCIAPTAAYLLAVGEDILHGYVALLLGVDRSEISCHPRHIRDLSLR